MIFRVFGRSALDAILSTGFGISTQNIIQNEESEMVKQAKKLLAVNFVNPLVLLIRKQYV